jgi:hypothetical protein
MKEMKEGKNEGNEGGNKLMWLAVKRGWKGLFGLNP